MPALVFACLHQHETEIVVRFRIVGPQTNGFAELAGDAAARRPLRPSIRPSTLCASARSGRAGERLAEAGDGVAQSGSGARATGDSGRLRIVPRVSILSARRKVMPRSTKTAALVGKSAIARCRLARAPARSPCSRSAVRETRAPPPRDRARGSAAARSRALSLAPLIPQRDAEIVVRLGRLGRKRDGALQVSDAPRANLPAARA